MILYKILVKNNGRDYSPVQNYDYGTLDEIINKEFICDDFDESDK